jgi:hypothetical protein
VKNAKNKFGKLPEKPANAARFSGKSRNYARIAQPLSNFNRWLLGPSNAFLLGLK